jgi:hypothetical protein
MTIIRIGLDTAKHVFQVHGVDENEQTVVRRQLRRGEMGKFFNRKGARSVNDKRVVFRRDGYRYNAFLDDDRLGFVRRADNGAWNFVDTTMAHSGYTKTRQRAGQLLRRRFEQMVPQGEI